MTANNKNNDTTKIHNKPNDDLPQHRASPSWFSILLSTIAAAFGVQSNKNRQRDFRHGSIGPYIVAGIIVTLGFVVTVSMVVRMVLKSNGL